MSAGLSTKRTRFKSCAAVSNLGHVFLTLHCSNSLSFINEYLAIDNGGYLYMNSFGALIAAGAFLSSSGGVRLNRSARELF